MHRLTKPLMLNLFGKKQRPVSSMSLVHFPLALIITFLKAMPWTTSSLPSRTRQLFLIVHFLHHLGHQFSCWVSYFLFIFTCHSCFKLYAHNFTTWAPFYNIYGLFPSPFSQSIFSRSRGQMEGPLILLLFIYLIIIHKIKLIHYEN